MATATNAKQQNAIVVKKAVHVATATNAKQQNAIVVKKAAHVVTVTNAKQHAMTTNVHLNKNVQRKVVKQKNLNNFLA